MNFEVQDWGRIDYATAWARQKALLEERIAGRIPDTLIFCEHDPVFTIGRGAQRGEAPLIINQEIPRFEIERGGLVTYHGPGQIVIYPIFKMDRPHALSSSRGVLGLIRGLEDWVVSYLGQQGLRAGTVEGKTGVWIESARKIASIGIAARHWVSYHGLALNLSTGSEPWSWINPCGFEASVMTDLSRELGRKVSYEEVKDALLALVPFRQHENFFEEILHGNP